MLFRVTNKKVFQDDDVVTAADLNEISEFTLEANPLIVDTIPAWFRVRITSADFTAAATTEDIELYELPTAGVVHGVAIVHSQAFGGGGITAYTLSVGITGNLTKYAGAFNVFQAPGNTVFQLASTVGMENAGDVTSIKIAATSTTANLSAATTGSADIYILMSRLPLPA